MILGMSTSTFTLVQVVLSPLGIFIGAIVLFADKYSVGKRLKVVTEKCPLAVHRKSSAVVSRKSIDRDSAGSRMEIRETEEKE